MNNQGGQLACREFNEFSRRRFLAVSAAAGAAATLPEWMPRVSMARDYRSSQRDVLIVAFLRGGADALTICPPFLEQPYYDARPTLAIPPPSSSSPNRAINLDGQFGLAPAMAPILPAYEDGRLLFVHAVGSQDYTRSHFEAARLMEIGVEDPASPTGWLTRHLNLVPADAQAVLRGIAISDGVPKSLFGASRVLPIPDPGNFSLRGDPITQAFRYEMIRNSYVSSREPTRSFALSTYNTVSLLSQLDFDSYQPGGGAEYPETRSGRTLRAAAAITKAQVGVEVMTIELGLTNWDLHQAQSPFSGIMAREMDHLSRCLDAFRRDMFAGSSPSFTLVAMSEFGRTLHENASGGTDHGHGGMMMVMGSAVHGGRVLTQWPGLAPEQLYESRDLAATFDYRDILAEILEQRLGNPSVGGVFSDFQPTFRGVFA
ncbi:MAG: DUF1501 domain-containing protein [Phycisphaerales bacterium]